MPEPVYIWKDFEFPITPGFAVTDCVIVIYNEDESAPTARGTVSSIDYCEHAFAGTDEWQARRVTATEWRVENAEETCWGKDPDGRLRFTASERIDSALQAFVSDSILEYERHREPGMQIVICPPSYKGQIIPYVGPCICDSLNYKDNCPRERKFPNNCFDCSCGKCFWLPDKMPNGTIPLWMRVSDPLLWERLLRHNGTRNSELCLRPDGTLELLTTYLRRTGDILLLGPLVAGKTRVRGDVTITSIFDIVVEG